MVRGFAMVLVAKVINDTLDITAIRVMRVVKVMNDMVGVLRLMTNSLMYLLDRMRMRKGKERQVNMTDVTARRLKIMSSNDLTNLRNTDETVMTHHISLGAKLSYRVLLLLLQWRK